VKKDERPLKKEGLSGRMKLGGRGLFLVTGMYKRAF